MSTFATPADEVFDARDLPCETKRPELIARCAALQPGRSFVFLNNHDPAPVRRFLDERCPGCFRWELLQGAEQGFSGLRVTKIAEPAGGFPAGFDVACS